MSTRYSNTLDMLDAAADEATVVVGRMGPLETRLRSLIGDLLVELADRDRMVDRLTDHLEVARTDLANTAVANICTCASVALDNTEPIGEHNDD